MKPPRLGKIALAATLLAAAAALILLLPAREFLIALVERVQAFGIWGLLLLGALYVPVCVLLLPGSVFTMGAGWLAGLLWPNAPGLAVAAGTLVASCGSVAGATAAVLLGRSFFRERIARKTASQPKFQALNAAAAREGLKLVLLVRLSPVFPFNLLNYALGLTQVRIRDYVLGSWIGMLPGTVLFVYLGTSVSTLTLAVTGAEGGGGWARTALLLLGLLATLALVIWVTRLARQTLAGLEQPPGQTRDAAISTPGTRGDR